MSRYRVWECKVVVTGDALLPVAFDGPPRMAAIEAVEGAGIKVLGCFSGWGGKLDEIETAIVENRAPEEPEEGAGLSGSKPIREGLAAIESALVEAKKESGT